MNDFHEAMLMANVPKNMGNVYKKAIEAENNPNGLRDHWNGNYANVQVDRDEQGIGMDVLVITLLSHTLTNLKETVKWYEQTNAKIINKNYKRENQKGNDQN